MEFLNELEELIESKHLLKHPFYLAWSEGKLSKECLKEYAKEYYHHVKAFPTYLSAIHSHTEDPETRKALLKNLIEEEAGSPNHPELWHGFAKELGATEQEIEEHRPNLQISSLIETFKQNCAHPDIAVGIASLYAYESQIPEICISKISGLRKFYGMTNPKSWEYFTIHIHADQEHSADERELLKKHVQEESQVLEGAKRILERLNDFLTGLCHRYEIACN
jgi:pyrroloquinoline-quinone synthase